MIHYQLALRQLEAARRARNLLGTPTLQTVSTVEDWRFSPSTSPTSGDCYSAVVHNGPCLLTELDLIHVSAATAGADGYLLAFDSGTGADVLKKTPRLVVPCFYELAAEWRGVQLFANGLSLFWSDNPNKYTILALQRGHFRAVFAA